MALVQRAIETQVRDALRVNRAVAITGPRQSGKTTLTRQLQAAGLALNHFSLDDDATRAAARADPEGFALSLPRPAVIDEVQRVPALLRGVERVVGRDATPGQFLLTASVDLEPESAAVAYLRLWPLAQAELVGARSSVVDLLLEGEAPNVIGADSGRAAIAELVLVGGFPPAFVMTSAARERYFRTYVEELLERDVPEVGEVRLDASKLQQLLDLLAARDGAAVNHAALARELNVDDKTVKAHVELLARVLVLYRLPPFSGRLGVRQVKAPRMALCDSGMAASLAGIDAKAYAAPDGAPIARMLLETFAVMELVKQATWSTTPVALSFYRDTEKRTVDLVIESTGGDVVGICASAAASTDVLDTRGLRLLRERLGSRFRAGIVVYTGERTVALDDRLWALPLHGLLQ